MMAVEQFRSELDAALSAAAGEDSGPEEMLRLHARWDDQTIVVDIAGPGGDQQLSRPRLHR